MTTMPITKSDRATAARVGSAKQSYSVRQKLPDYGPSAAAPANGERQHVLGCLGEFICARFFGVEFDDSEDGRAKIDCKIFEVRTRDVSSGKDLAIRPHDKMRLPHVLVWIEGDLATIVGWLVGWEGHARAMQAKADAGFDVWWQPSARCWFVPPPYHSVASLQDWIACGHPLHWSPPEYAKGVVPT